MFADFIPFESKLHDNAGPTSIEYFCPTLAQTITNYIREGR